jgi:hypothetical protein
MNYYYKLISKQDITRTFVVNKKALVFFFNSQLHNHGDEVTVLLKYNSSEFVPTKMLLHQDCRLLIQGRDFKIGQIAFFERLSNNTFELTVVKNEASINTIKRRLIKNHYISNTKIDLNAY